MAPTSSFREGAICIRYFYIRYKIERVFTGEQVTVHLRAGWGFADGVECRDTFSLNPGTVTDPLD